MKEKSYDELLQNARKFYEDEHVSEEVSSLLEALFPELKESKDEDSIKNSLMQYLWDLWHKEIDPITPDISTCDKWISWIEKQGKQKPAFEMKTPEESLGVDSDTYNKIVDECIYGEQKSADEVEPKFKVGDWVVTSENKILQITSIVGTTYKFNNESHYWESCYCDEKCRLWTIQDAKDGDVLAVDGRPFIYSGKVTPLSVSGYCGITCHDSFKKCEKTVGYNNGGWTMYDNDIYPATKEQRDTLFAEMHKAGYMWDSEKKELKKSAEIPFGAKDSDLQEETYYIPKGFHAEIDGDKIVIKKGEQKPAEWTEEDERMLESIMENCGGTEREIYAKLDWLQSLKDRVQPKQNWTEEVNDEPKFKSGDSKEEFLENVNFQRYPKYKLSDIHEGNPDSDVVAIVLTCSGKVYVCKYNSGKWYQAAPTSTESGSSQKIEYTALKESVVYWISDSKPEPKFKPGDTIVNKTSVSMGDGCSTSGKIKKIEDGKYVFSDGSYMHISEQDSWELKLQGEQKPASKFKVGDWVVREFEDGYKDVGQITDIKFSCDRKTGEPSIYYYAQDINGNYFNDGIDYYVKENDLHLWTIEDAKEGDILAKEPEDSDLVSPFVAIYKERGSDFFNSHCFVAFSGVFYKGETGHSIDVHPATQSQLDILFDKMKEAGYSWDSKEKKLTASSGPKFKPGDWIVDARGRVSQVISVDEVVSGYTLSNGSYFSGIWANSYRLWTIEDAKNGDVLASYGVILIVNEVKNTELGYRLSHHCAVSKKGTFEVSDPNKLGLSDGFCPATKEQRDLIFQKMKDAGYEWDSDKKEVKTSNKNPNGEVKLGPKIVRDCGWSDDDDHYYGENVFKDLMGY